MSGFGKKFVHKIMGRYVDPIYQANEHLDVNDKRMAITYAYRYLLNREPESIQIVNNNTDDWKALRQRFMDSIEYKQKSGGVEHKRNIYIWQKTLIDWTNETGLHPDYELILEQSYRKLISPGETVIDIGAHTGRHSKVFSELVGVEGKLYAFEPLPEQFTYLKNEFSTNHVRVINKALSEQAGVMDFYQVENYPEESGLRKRVYNADNAIVHQIQVEVTTLDSYVDELDENGVSYIKIDAEGAELSILKGGQKCLERFRPIISIEYGKPSYSVYGLTADSLYNFASEHMYYISDLCGNIVLNIDMWHDVCDSVYWDYFLIPKEKVKEFYLRIHS